MDLNFLQHDVASACTDDCTVCRTRFGRNLVHLRIEKGKVEFVHDGTDKGRVAPRVAIGPDLLDSFSKGGLSLRVVLFSHDHDIVT